MKRAPRTLTPALQHGTSDKPTKHGPGTTLDNSPRQQRQRALAAQIQQGKPGAAAARKELALLNAALAEEEEEQRKLKEKQKSR
ncbi:hypothetical protein [Massilia sp. TS11]|uniref:hypothetical protein n=1 Tax=Massilia sp. TS11 TaxID=2908003 RepID=UPI001EDBE91F|nr:hypothetical protein [Massilia sp. TS11]MCG2584149.1 hypothetical protein [Massilia sp. TS11]